MRISLLRILCFLQPAQDFRTKSNLHKRHFSCEVLYSKNTQCKQNKMRTPTSEKLQCTSREICKSWLMSAGKKGFRQGHWDLPGSCASPIPFMLAWNTTLRTGADSDIRDNLILPRVYSLKLHKLPRSSKLLKQEERHILKSKEINGRRRLCAAEHIPWGSAAQVRNVVERGGKLQCTSQNHRIN